MRRSWLITLLAGLVCLAALVIAWRVVSRDAYGKTVRLLEQSERAFVDYTDDQVDVVLLHDFQSIVRDCGGTAAKLSVEQMRELAERYRIDEINIVGTNGFTISSTIQSDIGYDFRSFAASEEFLKLLKGEKFMSQPFRPGTTNPDKYRKYAGGALPDGSGFVQLGFDFAREVAALNSMEVEALRRWRIGQYGNYDFYDANGDGLCDLTGREETDGVITRCEKDGEVIYLRPFSHAGFRFVAILSGREYFEERDLNFSILAPTLVGIIIFLAFSVLWMSRAAERDRLHREAEDAIRARDLEMAKTIQLSALPMSDVVRRHVFSLSLSATTNPSKVVGGDFYDYYGLDWTHLAIVMADVSGKGIPAAMFMMKVKNEICNALNADHDLAAAVAAANRKICENNDAELFVTAWIGVLDVISGEIEYVNAGHERPYVRRSGGEVERIEGKGCRFLGMFPDAQYRVDRLSLKKGDELFLFTDGVTEAMNPARRLYGAERLRTVLAGCPTEPDGMIAAVRRSVREFAAGAEQSDDLTALALLWHGMPEIRKASFASSAESYAPAMDWLGREIALGDRKAKARLLNAADEVMTNIVNYSGAKEFTLTVECSPGRCRVIFYDDGKEYNPLSHPDPDTHASLADREEGGLGILMVKRLVDSVGYARENGRNAFTMVKFEYEKP